MPDDDCALLYGQLRSGLLWEALLAQLRGAGLSATMRESSFYTGGFYLRVQGGEKSLLTFERISEAEYLLHGEGDTVDGLNYLAGVVSEALAQLNFTHRMEVYDPSQELAGYFHHHWPQP